MVESCGTSIRGQVVQDRFSNPPVHGLRNLLSVVNRRSWPQREADLQIAAFAPNDLDSVAGGLSSDLGRSICRFLDPEAVPAALRFDACGEPVGHKLCSWSAVPQLAGFARLPRQRRTRSRPRCRRSAQAGQCNVTLGLGCNVTGDGACNVTGGRLCNVASAASQTAITSALRGIALRTRPIVALRSGLLSIAVLITVSSAWR